MSSHPPPATPMPPAPTPSVPWIWFIILGGLCTILGIVGAVDFTVTELLTEYGVLLFGFLFLIAGFGQVFSGLFVRPWGMAILQILCGVLYIAAGAFAFTQPIKFASIFTLLLAISLIIGGFLRIIFAYQNSRVLTWLIMALSGLVTIFVGAYILHRWPWDSIWVIGLFFAFDLIFQGFSWLMLGANLFALNRALRAGVNVEITGSRESD